jgi:hypothetical protein
VELSPEIEEEYKKLTRDYDTLQKFYTELLGKQSESAMTTDMERRQQGEQIRVLDPATFPADPTFPNRGQFAGAGLGAGLLLGVVIALAFELRDTAIRNELDVEASLALPTLVLIPRVSSENGFKRADDRNGRGRPDKELKDQANAVRL